MDIVSLLKNFTSGGDAEKFLPLFNLLRENSFDLKKTLNSLTPETLTPLLENFLSAGAKKNDFDFDKNANGVTPIANIADREIVYTLNRYLNSVT